MKKHKEDQNQVIERLGNTYYNKDFIFAKTERQYGYPIVIKNCQNRMASLLAISGLNKELTPHSLYVASCRGWCITRTNHGQARSYR
ncbi:hypothetical protein [Neobacillus jeddahensis]|uniref:hypothetical protein n=1 Tax=Neobacillus jeddahensis TaxID=1461580 RepID=UPI0006945E93|nr:hypothetical protein [Neobacillus jeddahensis]